MKIAWIAPIVLASMLITSHAHADNAAERLLQSCMKAAPNKNKAAQAMCQCQANKWASRKISSPKNPAQTYAIKERFIEELEARWDQGSLKPGAHLQGEDAEKVAIAFAIGMSCAKELGDVR